jgi:hypothetical protein
MATADPQIEKYLHSMLIGIPNFDVKDSTLKVYIANIKKIVLIAEKWLGTNYTQDDVGRMMNLVNIIIEFKHLKHYFEENNFTDNTKKNYMNAIILITKMPAIQACTDNLSTYKKQCENIFAYWDIIKNRLIQKKMDNVKTQEQEENWLTTAEFDKLIKNCRRFLDKKLALNKLTAEQLDDDLQEFVLLLLYRGKWVKPLRNDYAGMLIAHEGQDLLPNENYIIYSNDDKYGFRLHILLNDDKVSKKYGSHLYKIPLASVLNKYLVELVKRRVVAGELFLLKNKMNCQAMTKNNLTKYLQRVFRKFAHKTLSSSQLRAMFISGIDFNNTTNKKLDKISKEMRHSITTQQTHYKKVVEVQQNNIGVIDNIDEDSIHGVCEHGSPYGPEGQNGCQQCDVCPN